MVEAIRDTWLIVVSAIALVIALVWLFVTRRPGGGAPDGR
jgi:hypothetical protein